jgi:hypothetical protein
MQACPVLAKAGATCDYDTASCWCNLRPATAAGVTGNTAAGATCDLQPPHPSPLTAAHPVGATHAAAVPVPGTKGAHEVQSA